jgi:hypothetical protein
MTTVGFTTRRPDAGVAVEHRDVDTHRTGASLAPWPSDRNTLPVVIEQLDAEMARACVLARTCLLPPTSSRECAHLALDHPAMTAPSSPAAWVASRTARLRCDR